MKFASRKVLGFLIVAAAVAVGSGLNDAATAQAAEPPAAPKVSSFAPAKDIASQIVAYVARLEESVATEEDFKESEAKLAKDANTLILLALAAGLDDQENPYKAAAPAIMKAARELTQAKGYAAAKVGVAEVKKAAESTGGNPAELKWVKSASLPALMKQVPLINSRLKRNLRGRKFKSKAKSNAGDAATLAVIAQGSMADDSEAKKTGEDVKKWYGFCTAMRDAAAALNKAIHQHDQSSAKKALGALNQSCDQCHAVFHKEAEKESDKE